LPHCGIDVSQVMNTDEKPSSTDLVPLGLARTGQYAISSTPGNSLREKVAKPEYWLRLRPWSLAALSVAMVALAAAIVTRVVLAEFGMSLYFATFLPAILFTALLAGVPAAAFTCVSSAFIVWWAFLPPVFEFTMPSRPELHAITLFLLSTALLVWFGHLCRTGLRMRKERAA
jgi:K+-sensing histidine kinase KdpD